MNVYSTIDSVQAERMVGNFGWTVKVNLVSHRVRHLSDEDHLLGYHVHVLLQGQARREASEMPES